MTPELYLTIGAVAGVLTFVIGVVVAAVSADDAVDTFLRIMLALCTGAMASLLWPAAVIAGVTWAGVMWLRHRVECMEEAERREERRARLAPPETDAQKYRRMAREQRDLAKLHQKTPELADLHEATAVQYEGLARVYTDTDH